MIDTIGGEQSIYYRYFEDLCKNMYQTIRKHTHGVYIYFYLFHYYDPKEYPLDKINKLFDQRLVLEELTAHSIRIFKIK